VGNQSAFLGGVEGTVNGADLKKEGPHGEKLHQNREIADTWAMGGGSIETVDSGRQLVPVLKPNTNVQRELLRRGKLSRRDCWITWKIKQIWPWDMALCNLTFRKVSMGKWSKNWACYRGYEALAGQNFAHLASDMNHFFVESDTLVFNESLFATPSAGHRTRCCVINVCFKKNV